MAALSESRISPSKRLGRLHMPTEGRTLHGLAASHMCRIVARRRWVARKTPKGSDHPIPRLQLRLEPPEAALPLVGKRSWR